MGKKTRKQGLTARFKKAKVNWPWLAPIRLPRELDTAAVNGQIERNLGREGHRAMEEIRRALILIESPNVPSMKFDSIPRGSSEWSAGDKALWKRFWLWQNQMKKENHKAREATILFSKGYRLREIERMVHARSGTARAMIFLGAKVYCEIMRDFT